MRGRVALQAVLLGGAAGAFVGPDELDVAAHARGHPRAPARRSAPGVVMVLDDTRRPRRPCCVRIAAFFRDESCGQCVPCRVGTVRQEEALAPPRRRTPSAGRRRARAARTTSAQAMRDASICGLGQTAWNAIESAVVEPRGVRRERGRRDDACTVEVPSTASRHGARRAPRSSTPAAARGVDDPDALLRRHDHARKNVCRVCVVEVEGSRALVPACSRAVEAGHGRAHRHRAGPPRPAAGARAARLVASTCRLTDDVDGVERGVRRRPRRASAPTAATVAQPVKVDNDLYVRDYAKCILCYQCVDACGEQWQNTFAIAVAGRGFESPASPPSTTSPLPESACVYCGNCIEVCPTGALMFRSEHDDARRGHVGRGAPDRRPTRSARTAASAARSRCTCRTTES